MSSSRRLNVPLMSRTVVTSRRLASDILIATLVVFFSLLGACESPPQQRVTTLLDRVSNSSITVYPTFVDKGTGHFMADSDLSEILSADYSALVVPAGSRSTATLVGKPHASRLIKAFLDAEKPVAVLGDAAKLLVAADVAGGRSVASDAETQEELSRAGATIAGEEIIVDATLISVPASAAIADFLDVLLEALIGDDDVERAA